MGKVDRSRQKDVLIWITSTIVDLSLDVPSKIEAFTYLAKRGYDVYVLAPRSKKKYGVGNSDIQLLLIPLRFVPILSTVLFSIVTVVLLPFLVVMKRPAFIVVSNGPQVLSVIWKPLLRLLKSKIILDVRSTPVEKTGLRGRLLEMWFNISVFLAKKTFDGMTVLTGPMKMQVCDRFGIDSEFAGVWTSGVSTALFDPEKYDGATLREKMGLANRFLVLHHGSLDFRRGIIEVLKAMEILRNEYDDIVLLLLGSGRAVPILRKLIEENDLQNCVIIHEPVRHADVPGFIAMCDVGIVPLPSLPEWRYQNPIKLLEYLAMKKPVILTDIPAHREVVGDSDCGIYVSAADPKEFAKAVTYARGNISVLRECGSIGRAIVEKRYKREKVAEDLENFLLRLGKSSHSEKVRTPRFCCGSPSKVKSRSENLSTSEKMIARMTVLAKNLLRSIDRSVKLSEAIEDLLENERIQRQFSIAGRNKAPRELSWDVISKQLVHIYREIAHYAPRADRSMGTISNRVMRNRSII